MTIIEPNKQKLKIRFIRSVVIPVTALVLTAATLGIFLYNSTVDLKHRLEIQEKKLSELKVANAELKEKIFGITDMKNIQKMALEAGFVADKQPTYLEISSLHELAEKHY